MTTNTVVQAGTDRSPTLHECPWRTRSLIHEDGAQQPNASPPVPFFSKNYSKFRAIFVALILPCRPRLWPSCHDAHGIEMARSTHTTVQISRVVTCVDWRQNLSV